MVWAGLCLKWTDLKKEPAFADSLVPKTGRKGVWPEFATELVGIGDGGR